MEEKPVSLMCPHLIIVEIYIRKQIFLQKNSYKYFKIEEEIFYVGPELEHIQKYSSKEFSFPRIITLLNRDLTFILNNT